MIKNARDQKRPGELQVSPHLNEIRVWSVKLQYFSKTEAGLECFEEIMRRKLKV